MCFYFKQSKNAQDLEHRFKAVFIDKGKYQPSDYLVGFQFPFTPVISNKHPNQIKLYQWGLIPPWAKDISIQKYTLNARIESINIKPSFKHISHQRCLVLSSGFYEWKWLDEKGKLKQKYLITLPDEEAFAFAGLWNEWIDKSTGVIVPTFTILTTEASGIMAEIHNSKNRMPIVLSEKFETEWLKNGTIQMQNHRLIAKKVA